MPNLLVPPGMERTLLSETIEEFEEIFLHYKPFSIGGGGSMRRLGGGGMERFDSEDYGTVTAQSEISMAHMKSRRTDFSQPKVILRSLFPETWLFDLFEMGERFQPFAMTAAFVRQSVVLFTFIRGLAFVRLLRMSTSRLHGGETFISMILNHFLKLLHVIYQFACIQLHEIYTFACIQA